MKTFLFASSLLILAACNTPKKQTEQVKPLSQEELIKRGLYLTTIGGCNDCHSPKVMTPMGPEPDPSRLFSGHPANEPLPPVAKTTDWVLFSMGQTAAVGPWGISYAANLTPDDTGIGNWTYEQFETALRKGKYKGLENARPLLPPMPWQMYKNFSDEDMKAVFTYLKSLKPIDNVVPAAISPDKLLATNQNSNQPQE
jgi:hypothetical protein